MIGVLTKFLRGASGISLESIGGERNEGLICQKTVLRTINIRSVATRDSPLPTRSKKTGARKRS